jgi:site-specific DNA-methyltransferase (adenine-specific)
MTPYYYQDDYVTLYCADCRDVLGQIADDSVQIMITDPPYSSGARQDAQKQARGSMLRSMEDDEWFSHDEMTTWGFSWFIRSVFSALRQKMTDGAHVYNFIDWRQTPVLYGLLESCGFRVNQCLVWAKEQIGMGAHWRSQHENIVFASKGTPAPMLTRSLGSVLRAPSVSPLKKFHPTQKPTGLIQTIIDAIPGELVLDPFAGAGSTLVAAKNCRRKAIGIEIEEYFCEMAANRLAQEVLPFVTICPQLVQAALLPEAEADLCGLVENAPDANVGAPALI